MKQASQVMICIGIDRRCIQTVRSAAPAIDGSSLALVVGIGAGQTDRDDVLLVDNVAIQFQQSDVVLEIGWIVARVHLCHKTWSFLITVA